MKKIGGLLYTLCCIATSMIGYTIHHSIFWAVMDFIFTPFALIKWCINAPNNIKYYTNHI